MHFAFCVRGVLDARADGSMLCDINPGSFRKYCLKQMADNEIPPAASKVRIASVSWTTQ